MLARIKLILLHGWRAVTEIHTASWLLRDILGISLPAVALPAFLIYFWDEHSPSIIAICSIVTLGLSTLIVLSVAGSKEERKIVTIQPKYKSKKKNINQINIIVITSTIVGVFFLSLLVPYILFLRWPILVGQIVGIGAAWSDDPNRNAHAYVFVRIANTGRAPSVATNFESEIEINGHSYKGIISLLQIPWVLIESKKLILPIDDLNRTAAIPIAPGDFTEGILRVSYGDIDAITLKSAKYIVKFHDINNRIYTVGPQGFP